MHKLITTLIQSILLVIFVSLLQMIYVKGLFADCADLSQVGRSCFEVINNPRTGTLRQDHRTVMNFVLGRDSFNDAEKLFGKAIKWHSGDASTSEDKICYADGISNDQLIIVFASNAEMSMGAVDQIRLLKGNVSFLDKCAKTHISLRKVQIKSGLHIGMTTKKMKDILGRPTEENDEMLVYSYCDEKKYKPSDPQYQSCLSNGKSSGERCSGITAGVSHGRVQWIVIWFGAGYVC